MNQPSVLSTDQGGLIVSWRHDSPGTLPDHELRWGHWTLNEEPWKVGVPVLPTASVVGWRKIEQHVVSGMAFPCYPKFRGGTWGYIGWSGGILGAETVQNETLNRGLCGVPLNSVAGITKNRGYPRWRRCFEINQGFPWTAMLGSGLKCHTKRKEGDFGVEDKKRDEKERLQTWLDVQTGQSLFLLFLSTLGSGIVTLTPCGYDFFGRLVGPAMKC